MEGKLIIKSWLLVASLLVIMIQGRASMSNLIGSTHQQPQTLVKYREEFQHLAIKRARGEVPEILRGVWLDVPIYRVEVTVDEQGNVIKVYPLYGNSLLAEAAMVSAREWKFPPQRVNGKPVRVVSAIDVEFQNLEVEKKRGLLAVAKQELQDHPNSAATNFNVGYAYTVESQYKEAVEYFQKAIEQAPAWAVAYAALGEACYGLGQYEKAIDCFRQAVRLKPDYYEPYQQIGWCYVRLKRDADAVKALLQAAATAKSSDDQVGVYWNLVARYESMGKMEDAADAQMQVAIHAKRYSVVAQHSPINASEEAFSAATKYNRLGKTENAMVAYREAMETGPLTELGLLSRLIVVGYLRKNNQVSEATRLLNEMVAMTNEAIRDYESSKNEHGLGNAYFWRGAARQELGQVQEAVADLRKAVRYKPDWGMPHLRLAYAYLKLGDLESARKEYKASGMVDEDFIRELANRSEQIR